MKGLFWVRVENEQGRQFDWPVEKEDFSLPEGLKEIEGYPRNFSGQPRLSKNRIVLGREAADLPIVEHVFEESDCD